MGNKNTNERYILELLDVCSVLLEEATEKTGEDKFAKLGLFVKETVRLIKSDLGV